MSLKNIESLMNKSSAELERFVEPILIEMGLIEKSTKGRNITQKGMDVMNSA
jgi:Holliday junction resolvasome RuvABC ATP-dependent DNA helicase subunit